MVMLVPQLMPLPKEGRYMLDGPRSRDGKPRPSAWWVDVMDERIDLPHGFRTDGASVPRILWPIFGSPFAPSVICAALLHDYLYTMQGVYDRAWADAAFRILLLEHGASRTRAWLMWLGVRLFGWNYWRRVPGKHR